MPGVAQTETEVTSVPRAFASLQEKFRQMDTNNDGEISYEEWKTAGGTDEEWAISEYNHDATLAQDEEFQLVPAESMEDKKEVMREAPKWGLDAMPLWFQKMFAEYIGMALFVFLGPASAINGGTILQIALTFGFAIYVLAAAIGHHSGGQFNCAVTLCLVITGDVAPLQGVMNFIGQIFGSVSGAFLLWAVYPSEKDATSSLGSNMIASGYSCGNALVGEIFMTFLLCFVVLEVACNPKNVQATSALAIGMAVFLAHSALIAVDGCSINPTRSVGPAIVASIRYENDNHKGALVDPHTIWEDHWVFWVGPLAGAAFAGVMSRVWWHPGSWNKKVKGKRVIKQLPTALERQM